MTVAILVALTFATGATAAMPGWSVVPPRTGVSEVAAVGERGTRLALSCATAKTASPRSTILIEGPAHNGLALKAVLIVGPTHFNLEFKPTTNAAGSVWSAHTPAEERAFRAIAMRIRASKSPVKLRLGTSPPERFPHDGAKAALGAQALQCPE